MLCCTTVLLFSCKDDEAQRRAETVRTAKQNDSILKVISENWRFNVAPVNPKVGIRINLWNEWRQYIDEISQKPTGSLTAYREKTKNIVNRSQQLNSNIPMFFDKPQLRSRIAVLVIKTQSLSTYINVEVIPDKMIISLIKEITHETTAIQNQMDELVRKSEIPKETGEEEMLKALDTVRMANPDMLPPQSQTSSPRTNPAAAMAGRNRT